MRTLLRTVKVATPDLGVNAFVEFQFFQTDKTHATPGGNEEFRLVARSSLEPADVKPSVMYSDDISYLEDIVNDYVQETNHEEYPSTIDWYEDDGL